MTIDNLLLQCLLYMNPNIGLNWDLITQNCLVFKSGSTIRSSNRVCHTAIPTDNEVAEIKSFFGDTQFTWVIDSRDHESIVVLQRNNLNHKASFPAMSLNLDVLEVKSSADDIMIEEIDLHNSDIDAWITIVAESFNNPKDELLKVVNTLEQRIPHALKLYLGFYQGKAAGAGMIILHHDMVSMHWIGTSPEFRHKGLGSALTMHVLHDVKKLGSKQAILLSSALGRSIYECIGFKEYALYHVYGN